jgi:hypothetical protein
MKTISKRYALENSLHEIRADCRNRYQQLIGGKIITAVCDLYRYTMVVFGIEVLYKKHK